MTDEFPFFKRVFSTMKFFPSLLYALDRKVGGARQSETPSPRASPQAVGLLQCVQGPAED